MQTTMGGRSKTSLLSLRKTFKYKLKPIPEQERELERVLELCCRLYNVALEHRKTAYERCHVSITRYEQEAELKEIRAALSSRALSARRCPFRKE